MRPQYTAEAMHAKIQGLVTLEALVLPDGSVAEVGIARSLDPVFGLDREAMRAVKAWTFARRHADPDVGQHRIDLHAALS